MFVKNCLMLITACSATSLNNEKDTTNLRFNLVNIEGNNINANFNYYNTLHCGNNTRVLSFEEVFLGTSNAEEKFEQYNLQGEVAEIIPQSNITEKFGMDKESYELYVNLNGTATTTKEIKEIGLIKYIYNTSGLSGKVMLYRKALDTPINLVENEPFNLNFKIEYNFI